MNPLVPDDAVLLARLRDEAAVSRPAFDAAAHLRLVAAVRHAAAARPSVGGVGRTRPAIALAACLGIGCAAVAWWAGGNDDAGDAAVAAAGLDALPTFDELGADVAGGIGSLAATVVGLPDWRELAVADLPIVEAWPVDREPVPGPGGSADLGPTR